MSFANKYVCVHGHFYQPPRENAWLEVVELQDSAAPFHDWNERINFECYAPNTAARLLDDQLRIINILNNYAYISYNFGPTLLSWMEKEDPETYSAIIAADQQSQAHFGGHGSALAQVHSHVIMPLANRRDKETQVIWGIKDFEYRFGRKPEGMWLAETAADTETLEVLAENDIKFTILAPRQGRSIRKIGSNEWTELAPDSIDPRRPYRCNLPSGKHIDLFFYHGEVSQAVAFERLLDDGKAFARRLTGSFNFDEVPQLLHIATDGESYGHHHARGEMALASCLNEIMARADVELTNYGQYLELFPPEWEARIWEKSSWSCVHGVERWRSNCGCNSGGHFGWTQEWRNPLRKTLNWLRDKLVPIYEMEAGKLLKDPWSARNDYISVTFTRDPASIASFIKIHAKEELKNGEKSQLLRLMEMQRQAMLMFTSCGWFFDEISGLETNQILQYANRAIYYANQVHGINFHDEFQERLAAAPSNVYENGAVSYQENVMPARVDLERVGMHFAAASLFEERPEELKLFNYVADNGVLKRHRAGVQTLVTGHTTVRSRITHSEKQFSFAVLHLGQQNIIGAISTNMPATEFDESSKLIIEAFNRPNLGEVLALMQQYFGVNTYSIWHLFRDEKRKILNEIIRQSLTKAESDFRDIYNDNYQLMTGIANTGMPLPNAYMSALEFVLNRDLQAFFSRNDSFNLLEIERLVDEFSKWEVRLTHQDALHLRINERVYQAISNLFPGDLKELQQLIQVLKAIGELELSADYWKSQNHYFYMLEKYRAEDWQNIDEDWKAAFLELGDQIRVRV
ncbi:MAG: DUF3536 domain-containing protein [Saprospiraceae bacterium]|nr:DUF3536 domain-containing protein [Lewinella sp.]